MVTYAEFLHKRAKTHGSIDDADARACLSKRLHGPLLRAHLAVEAPEVVRLLAAPHPAVVHIVIYAAHVSFVSPILGSEVNLATAIFIGADAIPASEVEKHVFHGHRS